MFKSITNALEGIAAAIEELHSAVVNLSLEHQGGEVSSLTLERISNVESRVEQVAGEAAADVVKAESIRAAARSAEERTRGILTNAQKLTDALAGDEAGEDVDSFEQAGLELAATVDSGDAEAVQGVPPVLSALERRRASREYARSQKRRA